MNLTSTELEQLTIFTAAELARRYRSQGIRLSHPEAVALISDEVLTAARKGMCHPDMVDYGHSVRELGKRDMPRNDAPPHIEVDPQTFNVYADGKLLQAEPATHVPVSHKYMLRRASAFSSCTFTNSVPRFARLVQPRRGRRGQKRMAPSNVPAPDSSPIPNVNDIAAA